jgi:membrane-associated protease RseP (regulator of RpoE activity)
MAHAMFIDPANGDFRVEDGSPALKLGFVNFPMDQFGVQKPELKAIARTPLIPNIGNVGQPAKKEPTVMRACFILQVKARGISGPGDRSAYGLPDETGVLILDVPAGGPAAKAGFLKEDVIRTCNDLPVKTVEDLQKIRDTAAGNKLTLSIIRKQGRINVELSDYAYVVTETAGIPKFVTVPLAQESAVLPAKVSSGGASTNNDPLDILTDGKVANSYGPVFSNGLEGGMYKLDLAAVKSIEQVNTFSALDVRSQQNFVLYGCGAESDPGWKVNDSKVFTPVISVDTRLGVSAAFGATSIRCGGGRPLGAYRWLVWVVYPVTQGNAENTAFQELQVIPARIGKP